MDKTGANIHFFSVYCDMAMRNHLTSLAAGIGKTKAVNAIVQTALQQAQQVFTCNAVFLGCHLIVMAELSLLYTINKLCFLLFIQLHRIFALFTAPLFRVADCIFADPHHGRADAQCFTPFQDRLHISCHSSFLLCEFLFIHVFFWEDGIHCGERELRP